MSVNMSRVKWMKLIDESKKIFRMLWHVLNHGGYALT